MYNYTYAVIMNTHIKSGIDTKIIYYSEYLFHLVCILLMFYNRYYFFLNLFIFVSVGSSLLHAGGRSLVVASGSYSSLQCAGFSLRWLLFVVEHGL